MIGDAVLDLHLVEEDHVGAAQIGGASRHALAALGAGGQEVDHARAGDHGQVHRGVQLGDRDQCFLGQRAGEHAVVAADAGHDLALGLLAEKLLGVDHLAPDAVRKPHEMQNAAPAGSGWPQPTQNADAAGGTELPCWGQVAPWREGPRCAPTPWRDAEDANESSVLPIWMRSPDVSRWGTVTCVRLTQVPLRLPMSRK